MGVGFGGSREATTRIKGTRSHKQYMAEWDSNPSLNSKQALFLLYHVLSKSMALLIILQLDKK